MKKLTVGLLLICSVFSCIKKRDDGYQYVHSVQIVFSDGKSQVVKYLSDYPYAESFHLEQGCVNDSDIGSFCDVRSIITVKVEVDSNKKQNE